MGSCEGNCAACSGCGRELVLTEEEMDFLEVLAQVAFLPVARRPEDMTPYCFEPEAGAAGTLLLQCLEKKGLISLDYDKPMKGSYAEAYAPYPVRGSAALTQRGQEVLELLEYQGISGER